MAANEEWEIRNEFAAVVVRRVSHGLGQRLQIDSPLTSSSALLDATVLEALAQLGPERLAALVGLAMTAADEDSDQDTDRHV